MRAVRYLTLGEYRVASLIAQSSLEFAALAKPGNPIESRLALA